MQRVSAGSGALLLAAGVACTDIDLSVFESRVPPESPPPSTGGTSGGTGGSSSVAGAPGEGGSPPVLQETIVHIVDDFEDGDTRAELPGGWWYTVNDGTGSQQMNVAEEADRSGSAYHLHTEGTDFTDWGAAIGVDVLEFFVGGEPIHVLRFSARASSPREVNLHLLDGSGEAFTRTFQITTEWADYSVRLDQVFSVVGERVVPLDVATLHELQWFFFVPEPFDFRLDDVLLLRNE